MQHFMLAWQGRPQSVVFWRPMQCPNIIVSGTHIWDVYTAFEALCEREVPKLVG